MAYTEPGTDETPDLSRITLDGLDTGWSIDLDILLPQRPDQAEGTLVLKKRDTKVFHIGNNTFQEDVFVPGLQQPQGDFEPYPRLRDPIRNVKHSSMALSERITVYVGANEIPIALPKPYLVEHSALFSALNEPRDFLEGATGEMRLPEEDPSGFLLLVRFLVQTPQSLKEIQHYHWPYPCTPKEHCLLCRDEYLNTTRIPLHFRFCAMAERLGFEFPEEMLWPLLSQAATISTTLVQPGTVAWAVENSIEHGYFRRYVAKLLSTLLKEGQTAFKTYETQFRDFPELCFLMSKASFSTPQPIRYEWDSETENWKRPRQTIANQIISHSI